MNANQLVCRLLEADPDDPQNFLRQMPGRFWVTYRLEGEDSTSADVITALNRRDAMQKMNSLLLQHGFEVDRIYGAYNETEWREM